MERVTGIEPAFSAWEADVLPLNYTRRQPRTLADFPGCTSGAGPCRTDLGLERKLERVTGIEPAEPKKKRKRHKDETGNGRQVDAEWTPDD